MNNYEDIQQMQMAQMMGAKQNYDNFQRWLLDDYEEVLQLQNALRGIIIVDNKQEQHDDMRILNDRGARIITETYILPIIKNAKLSYYKENEINDIMMAAMMEIEEHIEMNMDYYNLKFENKGLLMNLLENYLLSVLKRALNGMEQERLSTTQKIISQERIEQNNSGEQRRESVDHGRKWLPF